MPIAVGDALPTDVSLRELRNGEPTEVTVEELVAGRRIVLFAVPGAFTPLCSVQLPGYVDMANAIKAKGIDEILCVAVNDAFVMGAWGDACGVEGRVRMIADGNGEFARALGLLVDSTRFGEGHRSQRYAMVVTDGRVEQLFIEPVHGLDVSSAESVLKAL